MMNTDFNTIFSQYHIVEMIRDYVVAGWSSDFARTVVTLKSFTQLFPKYSRLFDPFACLLPLMRDNITEIAFKVFQSEPPVGEQTYRSHSMGNPVRYNNEMYLYVNKWYRCKKCLQSLIQYFIDLDEADIGLLYMIKESDWLGLFCDEHTEHLRDKKHIVNWKDVQLRISPIPDATDELYQFDLIIYTYYRHWRWC